MNFPKSDTESLVAYYGQPWRVTAQGMVLDPAFEAKNIQRIAAPYAMFMGEQKIIQIAVHKRIASSLYNALSRISKETSATERKEFGLDQYAGCFNFRPIRGVNGKLTASKLSLHAYGAAIDIGSVLNPLGKPYDPAKRMMPHEVIEIFRSEGWKWGGEFTSRPDCMHFQATL